MKFLVKRAYQKLDQYKAAWLIFCTLILGGLLWVTLGLKVNEDIANTLPESDKIETYKELFLNSTYAGKLIIGIYRKDGSVPISELYKAVDHFAEALDSLDDKLIEKAFYRIDQSDIRSSYQLIYDNLPVFLPESEISRLFSMSDRQIEEQLQQDLNILMTPGSFELKDFILKDPVGLVSKVLEQFKAMDSEGLFKVQDDYLVSQDEKMAFIMINPKFGPSESRSNEQLIDLIENVLNNIQSNNEQLGSYYFGSAAIAVANARQIKQDIKVTATTAITLIILLVGIYYRNVLTPVLFLIPAVGGAIFGLAVFTFIRGSISAISIGAGSIIIGIAIDYAFHFFTDLKHKHGNVLETLQDIANPLALGCATTSGALFILTFLNSPILIDFGLLAGISLIGAAMITLFVLPHLVTTLNYTPGRSDQSVWLTKLTSYQLLKPINGLVVIVVVTVLLSMFIPQLNFDDDLNNINYFPSELKEAQRKLFSQSSNDIKTIFTVVNAEAIEEALQSNEQLMDTLNEMISDQRIEQFSSLSLVVPSQQKARNRITKWNQHIAQENTANFINKFIIAGQQSGFNESAFEEFYQLLNNQATYFGHPDSVLFQNPVFRNFIFESDDGKTIVTKISIQEHQKEKVLPILDAIEDVSVLDQTSLANQLAKIVSQDFNLLLFCTSGIVLFTLIMAYGRIELALMTFLPMVVSWVWILGLCGLFGIQFNLVNVIVTTFIFGLGDDYCIFVTEGILSKYRYGKSNLPIFKNAIFLSVLTTIIGTGVLFLAKHPALQSIALLSVIGMISILFVSFSLQPLIFRIFVSNREEKGYMPMTIKLLIKSVLAFLMFVVGCVFLIIMRFIMVIIPLAKKHKKAFYQLLIHRFAFLIIWTFYHSRMKKINFNPEVFKEPGIIISNHTSFIDILVMLSLHPKAVMMTNKWVWNSPIFGIAVRYADFIYINDPPEINEIKIRKHIESGYSIIIFPEGTRSTDGSIQRFHKGAFYIADQLGLNIYPVLSFGIENTITKGDFLVTKMGFILRLLDSISPSDKIRSNGYARTAKKVKELFVREKAQTKINDISSDYFRTNLQLLHIYKGALINHEINQFLSKTDMLDELMIAINNNVRGVSIIGGGYGLLANWLKMVNNHLIIHLLEIDDIKLDAARNGIRPSSEIIYFNSLESLIHANEAYLYIWDANHFPQNDKSVGKVIDSMIKGQQMIVVNHHLELNNIGESYTVKQKKGILVLTK